MPVFTSYDAVGLKEDISDIIVNISPTKTPFQSMIGREKVTQKFFQWQEDSLRAAAVNAQVEGFDASFITVNPTVMRSNVTQILAEASQVSGSMDVTSVYGRAKESAYQLAKSAAQVKRDLEVALIGNDQAAVTGSDGVARKMASASELILNPTQTSAIPGASQAVLYSGLNNVLNETQMLTAIQNCYNNGAEPNTLFVTPSNSLNLAIFAKAGSGTGFGPGGTNTIASQIGSRQRFLDDTGDGSGPKTIVNAVDVYVSPFGELRVVINRFINGSPLSTGTGHPWTLVFNPSFWILATLRPWFREVLAKTGDSIKQMIVGEFSLKHKNFLASAIVVDQIAQPGGSPWF